jgi:hypothetical protein
MYNIIYTINKVDYLISVTNNLMYDEMFIGCVFGAIIALHIITIILILAQ